MSEKRRTRDGAAWDQHYLDDELPWDSGKPDIHLGRVLEAHAVPPGRGLEIGIGTGTNLIWLAERGFRMTGVDISRTAIGRARKKAAAAGVDADLLVTDFLAEDVPGAPFDLAYDRGCFHTFEEPEERARFAARVAELLADGGVWHSLIGSTDGPPRDTGPPRRSAAQVTAALEPHFEILELRSTVFDQGDHREARAWVLVARKRAASPE